MNVMDSNKFRDALSGPVFIFFILLFVFAKWGPAIQFSTTTQTKGEPMTVSSDAKVTVTPDIATITVGIDQTGQSLKQVQDEVNKKSQDLVKSLKSSGLSDDDIKTTSYSVFPENDYQSGTPKIIGYRVSTNYQITIRNFDKINDILTTLTSSGANVISGVSFDLSDKLREEKLNEARKIASDKAKDKAKGLAQAANISLGKILNISESQMDNFPRPYLAMEKSISGMGGGDTNVSQPDIKPGTSELSVTVTLSYEVR